MAMNLRDFLREQRTFLRNCDTTMLDPRAQLRTAFTLIVGCVEEHNYRLPSRSWELSAASEATCTILLNIQALNNIFGQRSWVRSLGGEELKQLRWFQSDLVIKPTEGHFIDAMDFAHETATKMMEEFSRAQYYEPPPEHDPIEERIERECDRYRVAVVLPLLVSRMNKLWVPLRERMTYA